MSPFLRLPPDPEPDRPLTTVEAILATTLRAVEAERDQLRAERDDWKRQAMLLADRYAEAREQIRRASPLTGRMDKP